MPVLLGADSKIGLSAERKQRHRVLEHVVAKQVFVEQDRSFARAVREAVSSD